MTAERFRGLDGTEKSTAGFERPPGRGALRRSSGVSIPASERNANLIDWRQLKSRMAVFHRKWDLAVLVNLERGVERPGDLIEAISQQAEEAISWKVLIQTLRRLEEEGYVARREVSRLPRVTRYWLRPAGRRLVSAVARLDAWYTEDERCTG
jgi:DNA-binding HxlR family transcriptional regulator